MRKFLLAVSAVLLCSTLVGCSAFYPNWGASGLPEEPVASIAQEPVPEVEDSEAAESTEPVAVETDSATSPEPVLERKQVQVEIIMAIAEPDFGIFTVVAQVQGLAEAGGRCVMRFIGSDKEVSVEVRAEPSSDYTQCFPIEFPLDELPTGNGIVTVSYESTAHFGASPASSVVIP